MISRRKSQGPIQKITRCSERRGIRIFYFPITPVNNTGGNCCYRSNTQLSIRTKLAVRAVSEVGEVPVRFRDFRDPSRDGPDIPRPPQII